MKLRFVIQIFHIQLCNAMYCEHRIISYLLRITSMIVTYNQYGLKSVIPTSWHNQIPTDFLVVSYFHKTESIFLKSIIMKLGSSSDVDRSLLPERSERHWSA